MTQSGGQIALASPGSKFWGTCPPSPMIYAHGYILLTSMFRDLLVVVWLRFQSRCGLEVRRWTCDLQVAGPIPGRSAFT